MTNKEKEEKQPLRFPQERIRNDADVQMPSWLQGQLVEIIREGLASGARSNPVLEARDTIKQGNPISLVDERKKRQRT